jgi:SAM-dependent methyltransferase
MDKLSDFDCFFKRHSEELHLGGDFNFEYYNTHKKRFSQIFNLIPHAKKKSFAIELGATSFFQPLLGFHFGYSRVMGTIFSSNVEEKKYSRIFSLDGKNVATEVVSINLESDLFPLEDESVDFILCSEVIEHLDIDPMFMMSELNRILRIGGRLLLTTPNSCSARNFWKIANGYRPHFFMQYERSRSPYRHNIEWDVHGLHLLFRSAGFGNINYLTQDVFESPSVDGIQLLKSCRLPTNDRGDCIFMHAEKVSGIVNRWPDEIYV